MNSGPWTDLEVAEAVRLHDEEGLKPRAIAPKIGRSHSAVLGMFQRRGLAGYKIPPTAQHRPNRRRPADFARNRVKYVPPSTPRKFRWQDEA